MHYRSVHAIEDDPGAEQFLIIEGQRTHGFGDGLAWLGFQRFAFEQPSLVIEVQLVALEGFTDDAATVGVKWPSCQAAGDLWEIDTIT